MVKKTSKKKFLVLHGPNMNMLGSREPEIYGTMTYTKLNARIRKFAVENGLIIKIKQSNSEGSLIDLLQEHGKWADGVVFNPGAYTHYSYALRDAVASIPCPTVEVHLSDIQKREEFRKVSVIKDVCVSQISGLGWESYTEGLKTLMKGGKK